jgi:hypothetical protein
MLSTASTLSTAQASRAAVVPVRAAQSPARTALLEGVRQRNAMLDAVFYDVGKVTHEEAITIAPWLATEGTLLIVPPSGAGPLTLCPTLDDFLKSKGDKVKTLTVAGVGSSALGSAAFARNVADAVGEPVAAVVSGYGLADVMTEALGGFFWFGGLNGLRHSFEIIDRFTEVDRQAERALSHYHVDAVLRESRDTRTVQALLKDERFKFDLLIGHSKGNLILSEALYELEDSDPKRIATLAKKMRIVTVSAVIAMPEAFSGIIDIIGEWDWFGRLNSRPDLRPEYLVPHAWHHTNTEMPAHLPVTSTLQKVFAAA